MSGTVPVKWVARYCWRSCCRKASSPLPTACSSAPASANSGSATSTNSARFMRLAIQSKLPTMTARRGSAGEIRRSSTRRPQ